ncbi:CinA family nicotinamide mononucleotide deamidase-related protein [Oceanicoccus sp. KOV_DT_Chl]|uniref:CinA family nicotinamide mononucleotide deamidase-related protein n=1 Tax=Oceanicoccus sp. KOV_DT_Chl TaxID=1904639 RepID=UPI000C7C930A|nr:CinA family nicotinamide mononucleotide deamidase-related protein [Oceanicoccus sp. KOV_DT_Chl]
MKIQLLLTGNELMSGHTVDSNSAMIAELLANKTYNIHRKVTISDDINGLVTEMDLISQQADVLIVNGGLGPTVDDLTAQALSLLVKQPIEVNRTAANHLQQWCDRRKLPMNDANLKQAQLPKGVEIIPNPTGSAVGFCINHNDCLIICTPGVPSELRLMMEQTIVELICQRFPNDEYISTIRLQTFGLGESSLQQLVNKELTDWPAEVELGFRAGLPLLEVKLSIHNTAHQALQKKCYQQLQEKIGDYIIGENNCTLASAVIDLLNRRQQKITTAESCTGGLIAASITEIAGASAVFEAGFVTYSNSMKQQLIGVDPAILLAHGAVSEPVVLAMAAGAISRSGADYAIAVSGIAGPDGGSDDKPVGTVWMAWGAKGNLQSRRLQFNASRQWFQQIVTATTLDLIRRELSGIETTPRYFQKKK